MALISLAGNGYNCSTLAIWSQSFESSIWVKRSLISIDTFPLDSTRRVTFSWSCTRPGCSRTGRNCPSVSSWTSDNVFGLRSRLFGVMMTRGRISSRSSIFACLLRIWKYWAALVRFATVQLFSAADCKKRSVLPLECSRPCPSYPCGKSITSPDFCPHLARPAEINWSKYTWAAFAKSPNWASQITNVSGE